MLQISHRPFVYAGLVILFQLAGASNANERGNFRHVVVDQHGPADMHTKTVGDLNGDGVTDLVVAGTNGGIVWYESPEWKKHQITSAGGGWSTDAEVGDVDGDGDQDLVVSDWYQNARMVWFENPGKGIGHWKQHLIGKPRAHDIELGDFDRDGDLDIVTRQQGNEGNKLEIWIQQNPTEWKHRSLDCPAGEGLSVCDIDRDGDPDIVIANRWYETPKDIENDSWSEHLYSHQWQHDACVVQTGDINGDGRDDIVLSPAESKGGQYQIAWYEAPVDSKGARWTEHLVDDSVETVLHSLAVADVDGDGALDVITAEMHQGADPDEVSIYFNNELGGAWSRQVIAKSGSHGIRVADVDGDGDVDIWGANWSTTTQVDLWENRSNEQARSGAPLKLNQWTYIRVDNSRSGKAFGLALSDLTGDEYGDIVSGKYFYRNPGGDMMGTWPRSSFPIDVDALLIVDVDDDNLGDAIGLDAKGKLYWLEAQDSDGTTWDARHVGDVGESDHGLSSQGYAIGQLVPGGKPEIVINIGSIYVFRIPPDPDESPWPRTTVTETAYPEGVGVGDIDGDGDLDICGTIDNTQIVWWENPASSASFWKVHVVGEMPDKYADRFYLEDLNGDGQLDIVVSAANGSQNGVYWWQRLGDDTTGLDWKLHTVVVQDTTNSMDVADMDGDGDIDIISGEHRGDEKVAVWENDGRGKFVEHVVSTGMESHLGTRIADLDGDGDLDIVSIAWDDPQYMHLWRNDAIRTTKWRDKDVPLTLVTIDADPPSRPWYKMVGDVSGDGLPDIVVGGAKGPLVAYVAPDWKKSRIADGGWNGVSGEIADLDGDGDLDIVMGGVVWFENPGTVDESWSSHHVEELRMHDIEIADLDGDGRLDIVARDQSAFGNTGNKLHVYHQQAGAKWGRLVVDCPHGEGLKLGDVDGDQDADIVIGALWYENPGNAQDRWNQHQYTSQWIEPDAKVEMADINRDGRNDIVLTPAELKDQSYKVCWYEAPTGDQNTEWKEHVIIDSIECVVHSLGVGDLDGDGDIDVVIAEMHQGQDPDEVFVLLNQDDGAGWRKQILSNRGSHDIVIADIDDDGDLDIVGANHDGDHPLELWRNERPPLGAFRR